jgi:23S rRNA (cytidine1920-2'-O)/16S rRNA (cytidine1409-2'-O)-methyltransferase
LGSGGVVRDPALRVDAVRQVAAAAAKLNWRAAGVAPSPLPGPSGNLEFFLWLRRVVEQPLDDQAIERAVGEESS